MSEATPQAVERWLNRPWRGCPCGRIHLVAIERAWVGDGIIDDVAEILPTPAAAGRLLILDDAQTHDAAGKRVADRLRAAGHGVGEFHLPRRPHADDQTLERIEKEVKGPPDWVVAVGSGTINDLGKILSQRWNARQLTVGTAASMNGYASSIAAMTERGLKITREVAPPTALLLDTAVLAAAPKRLGAAGFGDLISKPVSGADWLVSNWFFGEPVCPTALSVADDAVTAARRHAEGIGRGDKASYACLIEALLLSGLSMTLAGASSPASGGEHLFSHYLDISAEGWQREPHLHGEQVAVGTRVSLELYSRLRAVFPDPPRLMDDRQPESISTPEGTATPPVPPEENDEQLEHIHRHLSPPALKELLLQAGAKARRRPGRKERVERLMRDGEELWRLLDSQLSGGGNLEEDLRKAGCPRTFGEIGVEPAMAEATILRARHMRERYTVLDLAADLGRLEEFAREIATAC